MDFLLIFYFLVLEDGGAAADQRLLQAASLELAGDGGDGARAVVGGLVEHDAVCHDYYSFQISGDMVNLLTI